MKYRGFLIEPRYEIDFKQNKITGEFIAIEKDVEFYEVFDPMDDGRRFCAENTVKECKKTIDDLLAKLCLKDNKPETWAKLDLQSK